VRFHPASGFGFAAGASALICLPSLPALLWPLICAALALAGGILLKRSIAVAFATAAIIGFAYACTVATYVYQDRLPITLDGTEVQISGRVSSLPIREARSVRFDLQTLPQRPDGIPDRLRLSWYDTSVTVQPGDCVHAIVKLKRPRGLVNPAGFDFERYAMAARIGATGYVTRRLADDKNCSERISIDQVRANIADGIDSTLAPGRIRATVKALAIGDVRELDDTAWDLFRATGTTHLIAISGLHVSLAGALGAAFVWCWYWLFPGMGLKLPRPLAMAIAVLIFATLYSGLAGFTLPTVRTLITLTAMLAGVLSRRDLGWWTRYSLALLVVLLMDPLAPLTPGFWLSFGAVAWLILAFGNRWAAPSRWRVWVLPQLGLSIALLPLGLAFFQQTSLASPLVNLIAVPYVTFAVVPLLLVSLALWPVSFLSAGALHLAAWLLSGFDMLIVFAADLPAARWSLPAPSIGVWIVAMLGCVWLLAPRGWPGRWLGAFGLLPLLLPQTESLPRGSFDLAVLDVGQGQAVVVRTATHALLIDTGPGFQEGGDLGDRVLVPSLVELGVDRLDRLIVSHTDSDHNGGTESVRRRFRIDEIQTSSPDEISLAQRCATAEPWQWDGVDFEILHPPTTMPYLGNESSCVVRIAGAGGSALVPGDIGEIIEGRLVREQAAALDVDFLVAPHHGSAGSSSVAFLDAVTPEWVIYSAGFRNRFDFPRAVVVDRVAALGAAQLTTGDQGAIRARFVDGKSIEIKRERDLAVRWWRER